MAEQAAQGGDAGKMTFDPSEEPEEGSRGKGREWVGAACLRNNGIGAGWEGSFSTNRLGVVFYPFDWVPGVKGEEQMCPIILKTPRLPFCRTVPSTFHGSLALWNTDVDHLALFTPVRPGKRGEVIHFFEEGFFSRGTETSGEGEGRKMGPRAEGGDAHHPELRRILSDFTHPS